MRPGLLRVLALTLVSLMCLVCLAQEKSTKKPKKAAAKTGFAHIGDLHADVAVLQVLHALQPTPEQVKAMLAASAKTMESPPPRKQVKVSERYVKALTALRDALAAGDDEQIEQRQAALDALRKKEDPEGDEVEITTEARQAAPALVRRLSARQIAYYVGGMGDFPDPVERLMDAMDECRKLNKKDWQTVREDVAFQVGYLVAGLDEDSEEKIRVKAVALMNKAARLEQAAYDKQRGALQKEAVALEGKVGPTDVIRHFMERVLAETLSNHRFESAVKRRKK